MPEDPACPGTCSSSAGTFLAVKHGYDLCSSASEYWLFSTPVSTTTRLNPGHKCASASSWSLSRPIACVALCNVSKVPTCCFNAACCLCRSVRRGWHRLTECRSRFALLTNALEHPSFSHRNDVRLASASCAARSATFSSRVVA